MSLSNELQLRLDKIRSPNLQNQKQVAVILNAIEDTLRDEETQFAPAAYFTALLSLLSQSVSDSVLNKDVASATVYLLDVFTPQTPAALLRSKFSQILQHLVPALTHPEADAPLLRSSIGVLEGILLAQDSGAWSISPREISPRRAVAGLLSLGLDERPKVRKRAQEALARVLSAPPPSPASIHPAAEMCATTALDFVTQMANNGNKKKGGEHDPRLLHALQLVKAVAAAGGWPVAKIEPLCEVLLGVSRSTNEFTVTAAFGVFEKLFEGMATDELTSSKLPKVLNAILELKPSHNDTQLLPAWLAVIARAYDVYAQVCEDEAFSKLPILFRTISVFLDSPSNNIRTSASQCLIALASTCVPEQSLLDITRHTENILAAICETVTDLLSVRYQGAWEEVFELLSAIFEKLRWRSSPLLNECVKIVGDLRENNGFEGKRQADGVLGKAVHAMGPDNVLSILPLNLINPIPGQSGRAWLLPILRENAYNTRLNHFREEMIPLSEAFFQKVVDFGDETEKTTEIKIFETLVGQIWSLLPGYCDLPTDLILAFDQTFAEMLANILYQKPEIRSDICRALQNLVDSNNAVLEMEPSEDGEEDMVAQMRMSKAEAKRNIAHLSGMSVNMLAVLFNVYSETLPQNRGFILRTLNAFLSITSPTELRATFEKVSDALANALREKSAQSQAEKQKKGHKALPPAAHTLMDLVITITPYLPEDSYSVLFEIFSSTVNKDADPQLQKKAYKIVPKLGDTETGQKALNETSRELQQLLISSASTATAPARRDRLLALSTMVESLPRDDLRFIPDILGEVIISAKEVNEKARTAAFDLLVLMGDRMSEGGRVLNSAVPGSEVPDADASLDEYFTMVGAALAASSPHMVSAAITALTRILFQYKDTVSKSTIEDLVDTLNTFLTSKSREIVRSVLGFVKVCVISLPKEIVQKHFPTMIPNLMVWSHEHKAHFKAKVKHILERMIRRFGVDAVDRHVPEEDKKLISNIRKTRERRRRKKDASAEGEGQSDNEAGPDFHGKGRRTYANAFEDTIYGSESEDGGSDEDENLEVAAGARKKTRKAQTYIHEDENEPLDLLDRRALGNISSTKPSTKVGLAKRSKAKLNEDGKLLFVEDGNDETTEYDRGGDVDMHDGAGGIDAYMEAVAGKDAYKRGQKGRVKFSNKRHREEDYDDDMDMDRVLDATPSGNGKKLMQGRRGLHAVKEGRVDKEAGRGARGKRGFVGGRGRGRARGGRGGGGGQRGRR